MRGRRLLLLTPALVALAFAGAAFAGNGGIAPPPPESPNAGRISDAYWLILGFTGAIFVLVEGALLAFVFRFRRRGRPRDEEGPQIRGHTRLELAWTAAPVLILAVIATFVFYKLPGIEDVPKAKAQPNVAIEVRAHQFYWEFRYPNGAISIDTMYAPAGRVVTLAIKSYDVDHSWWIPELDGKFDAIPGATNRTWFRADEPGTYIGQCGELCGLFHAIMTARVRVVPPARYEAWVRNRATPPTQLGRDIFVGACQKCHGNRGVGDYGPPLHGSPILADRRALETIVRNGRNKMPPVGRGWTKAEFGALFDYAKTHIAKEGAGGGGQG